MGQTSGRNVPERNPHPFKPTPHQALPEPHTGAAGQGAFAPERPVSGILLPFFAFRSIPAFLFFARQ